MIESLGDINIFKMFEDYEGVAPKNLEDLIWFEEECIKNGFIVLAELVDGWRTQLEYYKRREHDDSDEFYI